LIEYSPNEILVTNRQDTWKVKKRHTHVTWRVEHRKKDMEHCKATEKKGSSSHLYGFTPGSDNQHFALGDLYFHFPRHSILVNVNKI
jgi:hypothetical protein